MPLHCCAGGCESGRGAQAIAQVGLQTRDARGRVRLARIGQGHRPAEPGGSEIRAVNRADPVTAAEGVVVLAERIWPAFEHIDTSSGALGSAVRRTLENLVPVLIEAPADEPTRAHWLERLRQAIVDDGVDYLSPISDRFGEIAAFPRLMRLHADRDLDLIREAWADHARFSHVATATLTLSCLLEAGRHDELLALLDVRKTRLWFDEKFAAEALLRQGREEAALARAAALLDGDRQPWGGHEIARFCEAILVRQGKADEAYRRFGLPTAAGNTWLAMWRDLVRRYPDRDARSLLEDLIALHGRKGKWFAAAKTAGYFDIALDCAADQEAAPATLIRAARDFEVKNPAFAAQVALHAIAHLLTGLGYEPSPLDIDAAVDHLAAASRRIDRTAWAIEALRRLAHRDDRDDPMARRLRLKLAAVEAGSDNDWLTVGRPVAGHRGPRLRPRQGVSSKTHSPEMDDDSLAHAFFRVGHSSTPCHAPHTNATRGFGMALHAQKIEGVPQFVSYSPRSCRSCETWAVRPGRASI